MNVHEKEVKITVITVRVVTVIFFAIGLLLAGWVWPSSAQDLLLTNITLVDMLRAAVSISLVVGTIYWSYILWIEA